MSALNTSRGARATRTAASVNPQNSSLLFNMIPTEIRLEIYDQFFTSLTLTCRRPRHVREQYCRPSRSRFPMDPDPIDPYALSIFRCCKKMNSEIGRKWISQVKLNFEDLEILETLHPDIIGSIRSATILPINARLPPNELLERMPRLKIDNLTIYQATPDIFYDTCKLHAWVMSSWGREKLEYILHRTDRIHHSDAEPNHIRMNIKLSKDKKGLLVTEGHVRGTLITAYIPASVGGDLRNPEERVLVHPRLETPRRGYVMDSYKHLVKRYHTMLFIIDRTNNF
ncbi:hypothetical protein F4778DRAFT_767322 [Xylariomycetidae sp. FL2044]|nr:hypothetical protein F4778DRAFT_767322 [Xylariomycetidae sp. FL2044]